MREYKESIYNVWETKKGKDYLINTFSRAVIEILPKEKQKIESILKNKMLIEGYSKQYLEYKTILIKEGFLIKKERNELKELEYNYNKAFYSNEDLTLILIPTMRCNFKCPYCFEDEKGLHWNEEKFSIFKKFSKKNFQFKKNIVIGLYGGEPLLEWELLNKYFEYVIKLKKDYKFNLIGSITTNASLLTKEMIQKLTEKYDFKSFQITIDGNKSLHDTLRVTHDDEKTYDIVIRNLKSLIEQNRKLKNKLNISLRINLLNTELEDISDVFKEFSESDKKYFSIYFRNIYNTKTFNVVNKNKNNLNTFYSYALTEKFKITSNFGLDYATCEGDKGENRLHVLPDLSVKKCINNATPEANLGVIDEHGILNINHSKLQDWHKKNPFKSPRCKKCKLLAMCWGGCPLYYSKYQKRNCIYEKKIDLLNLFL